MLNKLEIIGHLGRDPEMRFTPSGQAVTNFSVATTHKYSTGSGEEVEETLWVRVSVWGKMAENCNQYLSKGSLVFVEGRITPDKKTGNPRVYENKKLGEWTSSLEMTASLVKFLSSRNDNGHSKEEYDSVDLPGFMED